MLACSRSRRHDAPVWFVLTQMAAALPPHKPAKPSTTGRAVLQARREPGQLIAGVFAIVVHIGFFALIVFGVSWQVKVPSPISAELWANLPPPESAPPVRESAPEPARAEPPPPAEPVVKLAPAPEVSVPSKADIALKAKKEQEAKQQEAKRRREQEEQAAREMKAREEEKRLDAKRFDAKRLDAKRQADAEKQRTADEAKQKAEADRLRAEADAKATAAQAARHKAISDYTGRIAALIRSRANIPDNVTGQPVIQLRVRLLTNGNVFEATVANPSGNRAYDEAVERAINGIRQWPVPDNPEILGRQRELLLKITHER